MLKIRLSEIEEAIGIVKVRLAKDGLLDPETFEVKEKGVNTQGVRGKIIRAKLALLQMISGASREHKKANEDALGVKTESPKTSKEQKKNIVEDAHVEIVETPAEGSFLASVAQAEKEQKKEPVVHDHHVFKVNNGDVIKSLEDLVYSLHNMKDEIFLHQY